MNPRHFILAGLLSLLSLPSAFAFYTFPYEIQEESHGKFKDIVLETGSFNIEYSETFALTYPDEDNNGLPDLVDEIWAALRQSERAIVDYLDFQNPFLTGEPLTVVLDYEYDLFGDDAGYVFGFVDFDERGEIYLALDPTLDPSILMPTIAHEFFHVVQFAYDQSFANSYQSDMLLESTAVWIEDLAFDKYNDYQRYTDLFEHPDYSIFSALGPRDSYYVYGLYIWPRFLSEYYHPGVISDLFEYYVHSSLPYEDGMRVVDAYEQLILLQGDSLNEAYVEFSYWLLDIGRFEEKGVLPSSVDRLQAEMGAYVLVAEEEAPALYGSNFFYFKMPETNEDTFYFSVIKPTDVVFHLSFVTLNEEGLDFSTLKKVHIGEGQGDKSFEYEVEPESEGVYVIISPLKAKNTLLEGGDTQFDYGYEYYYAAQYGSPVQEELDLATVQRTEFKKSHY